MKLKFLKQQSLDTLKENISANRELYINDDNKWIYEFFNGEYLFRV